MIEILTIVGARPQFVKAAVVSREIHARSDSVNEVIVHTGQHFDVSMSDVFFDELEIPAPGFSLGIGGGTHGENTGRMLVALERLCIDLQPDVVVVYGDTDSTLAGALAAAKLHVPVAHIEAGLRSFNRRMPEETNRVLTDHISAFLFTPTLAATTNLLHEGIRRETIFEVGDVMLDAAQYFGRLADARSDILDRLGLEPRRYVLATIHRAENVDDESRVSSIVAGLGSSSLPVILPLHPRTKNRISKFGLTLPECVRVVDPVGYLDMVALERNATLIATDSGGVQKEAYFHGIPCITLRDETEWVELVEAGFNLLVGADSERISHAIQSFSPTVTECGFYGDGAAGLRIVEQLLSGLERAG